MLRDLSPRDRLRRRVVPGAAGLAILLLFPAGEGCEPALAAPAGGEFIVNAATLGHQGAAAVAGDKAGGFIVVWESTEAGGYYKDIFMRRFDSAGVTSGPDVRVNTYTTGSQSRPSVASDSNGRFVVVWDGPRHDGSLTGVFGQRFDSSSAKVGVEFMVNPWTTSDQIRPAVAMNTMGAFTVVWEGFGRDGSATEVYGQRYDPNGAEAGGDFLVNDHTADWQGIVDVGLADIPSNFVVVWTSGSEDANVPAANALGYMTHPDGSSFGVFKKAFKYTGLVDPREVQANSYWTGFQGRPRISIGNGGDFIVVWQSGRFENGPDGSGGGISARYFALNGGAADEFQVNAYATGIQSWPDVAMDPNAQSFVVVWTGLGEGGPGVFGRRFKTASSPLGCDFPVKTMASGPLSSARVAMTGECSFVSVWTSGAREVDGDDGSAGGILARVFGKPGGTCAARDGAYCCPKPAYTGTAPYTPTLKCLVRWAGIVGAPSIDCPESLCSSRFAAKDFHTMLNERHARASDAIWDPNAAIKLVTATSTLQQLSIDDLDFAAGGSKGSRGDIRMVAFASETAACKDPNGNWIEVCSAADCTSNANCGAGIHCFIPAGAPAGTSGKCECASGGICGPGTGKCVHAYQPLGNGCISKELRDTWVCADCQWFQATGAPPCPELWNPPSPSCPARDPNRSEPEGILAVSANHVLTESYKPMNGHVGVAVIGSPTYPWLLVPDPQDDCGPCDSECIRDEGTLAHELGHVFSIPDDPNFDIYDPNISRAYLTGIGSGLCKAQAAFKVPPVPSGDSTAGWSEERIEYFTELIGDAGSKHPYLDIEKVRFSLGGMRPGASAVPRSLSISIGLAGLLPPWKGTLGFLIYLDTDGDAHTGCDPPGGKTFLMAGTERVIKVNVDYDREASKKDAPQFTASASVLGCNRDRHALRTLRAARDSLQASARIVYIERDGRASGGEGPDRLPIRSEVQVEIRRLQETLGLAPDWLAFQAGWRTKVFALEPGERVVDEAPDHPATLYVAASAPGGP